MAFKIKKVLGLFKKLPRAEELKSKEVNVWERELVSKEETLRRRIAALQREENIKVLRKQYEAMQEARRKNIWSVGKRVVGGYLEKIRTKPPVKGAAPFPVDVPPMETETVKGVTRWTPPQPQYRWEKGLLDGKWRKVMIY